MSPNLYTNQSKNVTKTWILMSVFFVIVIFIGWWLSAYYNDQAILIFAVIFSVVMNFASFWYSDKIVLKITGAKPANREEYFDLYTSVENLAITAGLPMPRVYVIEDSVPNAFATGRDKKHAAIAATTGLLKILNKSELEGVVAHEMAHIGNRDILLQTIVVVLVGFITLISDMFLRAQFFGGRDRDDRAGGIMLIVGIALMILSPIIATIIQLAISRKREFLADATGALLTRYPEGLASALEKISEYSGQKMQRANHATAHLFIASPFGEHGKKSMGFLNKLFSTHPPVEERVQALRGSNPKQ